MRPIVQGEPYFGTKWAPVLEAYGLVKGAEGKPFYATNEAEQRTYRGLLNADGSLSQITTFVEQGGESLAQDAEGNVYLAAGQIFAYSPGRQVSRHASTCPSVRTTSSSEAKTAALSTCSATTRSMPCACVIQASNPKRTNVHVAPATSAKTKD